jgi:23S rRNA (uracil1939-C5)-methyltransferase
VDVKECMIQPDECNRLLNRAAEFCRSNGLNAHNTRKHEGLMRNLVLRTAGDSIMACIVTHTDEFSAHTEDFTKAMCDESSNLKSLMWYVNNSMNSVAIAGRHKLLFGDSYLVDDILGVKVRVSPPSFMQTNHEQCETLYSVLLDYAQLEGGETVFDLYTGMGPIAMLLARRAGRVVGIESVEAAVADGRVNLELNGISNVELVAGEVEKVLPGLCELRKPDVVTLDPPRIGMHPDALRTLIGLRARRLVYISCNPSTLARDAAALVASGYELVRVQPVDMFPHTAHIECVAQFDLAR